MANEQYYRQMQEATRYLHAGDGKNAVIILARLHELYPDNVDVAMNLGAAYILNRQHGAAVPILEAASALDDTNPAVFVNLAAAYLGALEVSTAEQQDKAIDAFQRALALDPHHPNAHYNLGLIYADRREWSKARQMFQEAVKTNPNDRDARMLMAKAQKRLEEERSE